MTKKPQSYSELRQRLDNVLLRLQADDIDIDEALKAHQEGTQLIVELEKHLKQTKTKITKLSNTKSTAAD